MTRAEMLGALAHIEQVYREMRDAGQPAAVLASIKDRKRVLERAVYGGKSRKAAHQGQAKKGAARSKARRRMEKATRKAARR